MPALKTWLYTNKSLYPKSAIKFSKMLSYLPYTTCTLSTPPQQLLHIEPYTALRFAPVQWSLSHLGEERLRDMDI